MYNCHANYKNKLKKDIIPNLAGNVSYKWILNTTDTPQVKKYSYSNENIYLVYYIICYIIKMYM